MFVQEELKALIISDDGVVFGIGEDKNSAWQDMLDFIDINSDEFMDMPEDFCNAVAFLKRSGYSAEYATENLINFIDEFGGDVADKITFVKERLATGKLATSRKVFCLPEELSLVDEMVP